MREDRHFFSMLILPERALAVRGVRHPARSFSQPLNWKELASVSGGVKELTVLSCDSPIAPSMFMRCSTGIPSSMSETRVPSGETGEVEIHLYSTRGAAGLWRRRCGARARA